MKFNLAKRIELGMFFENMFLLARAVAGVGGGRGTQKGFQEEADNHLLRWFGLTGGKISSYKVT